MGLQNASVEITTAKKQVLWKDAFKRWTHKSGKMDGQSGRHAHQRLMNLYPLLVASQLAVCKHKGQWALGLLAPITGTNNREKNLPLDTVPSCNITLTLGKSQDKSQQWPSIYDASETIKSPSLHMARTMARRHLFLERPSVVRRPLPFSRYLLQTVQIPNMKHCTLSLCVLAVIWQALVGLLSLYNNALLAIFTTNFRRLF